MKQTDEALAKLIQKGIEVAEKTGNFVIDQAPDLLQEFYAWQLWSNIAVILICIFSAFFINKAYKKVKEDIDDELLSALFGVIFFIFPFVFLLVSAYNVLFILVAPKLYLIEYFVK